MTGGLPLDLDLVLVIATVVTIFATSGSVAGWVNRRWPWVSLISLALGLGLFGFVHVRLLPQGLGFWDIPNAFIHVAALVLN
jgi:hypothetical protein